MIYILDFFEKNPSSLVHKEQLEVDMGISSEIQIERRTHRYRRYNVHAKSLLLGRRLYSVRVKGGNPNEQNV